ncbi:MAG: P-loop NTPase [Caldilineaceae bacterium]|nr:P-loop NTPase [Caldilineaceae bacterium]
MEQQVLQLALISEHTAHSQAVTQIIIDKGWKALTLSSRSNPVAALRRQPVDLVLVDLDVPNAIELLRELTQQLPYVPLIALTTTNHVVEWQDAQLAGALDYVTFPVNGQNFFTTIARVLQHFSATIERVRQISSASAGRAKKERVIAVVSLKGGIGRSTVAVNLAVALRQRQQGEVILAEAHHGLSRLSLMLNLHPRHTLANLATTANMDLDFVQGLLQPHDTGIQLLAAPNELTQIAEIERERWQQTLAFLPQLAPYVVVDTAAIADAVLSEVLLRADEILMITGPEIASLYSTRTLLDLLRVEKEVHGRLHVVLNQAGVSGGLSEAVIQKHLGEPIVASIPADPPLATYALNRGVPFVASHARAPISRGIQQLATHLLAADPATAPKATSHRLPAFLSFLSQRA